MNTSTPQPSDWHRRPKGHQGPCPICGLPAGYNCGQHRATTDADHAQGIEGKWIARYNTRQGWAVRPLSTRRNYQHKPHPGPGERHHFGLTKKVRDGIIAVVTRFVYGENIAAIAVDMRIPVRTVYDWHRVHPDFWQLALARAQEDVVELVRQLAGTRAVLQDSWKWPHMVAQAEKCCETKGEPFFPPPSNGELRLSDVLEKHYRPARLADTSRSDRY